MRDSCLFSLLFSLLNKKYWYGLCLNFLIFTLFQWEITRIRNIGVRAWSSFASFLERRNTKVLDLRNMRLPHYCKGSKTEV